MVSHSNQVEEQVDLRTYPLQPEALQLIPKSAAIKYDLIPLTIENDTLLVAMADVNNVRVIQEMAAVCKKRIVPLPADPAQIYRAIDYSYKSLVEGDKQIRKAAPRKVAYPTVQAKEQVNLDTYPLQPEALQSIPASIAFRYNVMPLAVKKDILTVAMADVYNIQAIQEIEAVCKKRVVPIKADPDEIHQTIEYNYRLYGDIEEQPVEAAPQKSEIEEQPVEAALQEIEMLNVTAQIEEHVDLNTYPLQPEALQSIPKSIAVKYDLIPLALEKDILLVAMADINNMQAMQEMAAISKKRVVPMPADTDQIRQAIEYNYKLHGEIEEQPGEAAPQKGEIKEQPKEEQPKKVKMTGGTDQAKGQIDLNTYPLQPEALQLIPAPIAFKHNVIPLAVKKDTLTVAMADVYNMQAMQEMAIVSKKRIVPLQADADQIRQMIEYQYKSKSYGEVEKHLGQVAPKESLVKRAVEDVSDAPVVQALNIIMNEAVKARTSDIHLEPQEDRLRVRYRIDGVLQDTMSLPLSAQAAVISRIKVMANMNIADHRPQDGQLSFRVKDNEVDMRVATINTIYGEMATLRILDKSFATRTLEELGFSSSTLDQYQEVLRAPMGMILVCGPTGSGKTTTLYASINSLDRKGRKVITVEDPVEYRFENINQIQVNPKADITFSSAVRSFMRHDPDILLIGEIRDSDTASMAMQASLIGQLVLSSVHAKDAATTVTRLLDLGIGPFLISATLVCVMSQRMARKVCPNCRELVKIQPEALAAYANETGDGRTEFYVGRGCNMCSQTGYLGRTAISEIMVINHDIRSAILNNASNDEIRNIAKKSGMISMWHDGMLKAQAGITTPSEVLRQILFTG